MEWNKGSIPKDNRTPEEIEARIKWLQERNEFLQEVIKETKANISFNKFMTNLYKEAE